MKHAYYKMFLRNMKNQNVSFWMSRTQIVGMILKFLLDFRYQLFLLANFLYLGNLPYFIIRFFYLIGHFSELAASWVNFFWSKNPKNQTEPGLKFLIGFQHCFFLQLFIICENFRAIRNLPCYLENNSVSIIRIFNLKRFKVQST